MNPSVILTKGVQDDVNTSSKIPIKGGWSSAVFIIFVEFGERFGYFGVLGNLMMYLTKVLKEADATAAKNVNLWIGVSAIFPLVGGFVADSYFGKFNIIIFSSVTYLLGLVLLVISVVRIPLKHRVLPFFVALYIINIGEGGHRPCIQTFAADQFEEHLPCEKAAKRSFFNWWYSGIVFGGVSATLILPNIQDNIGWGWGFGIPAVVVVVALGIFLAGKSRYRQEAQLGSPVTKVAQVLVAAFKKRRLSHENGFQMYCLEAGESSQPMTPNLAHTNEFRFLDKAAFIDETDMSSDKKDSWRLCNMNQVEQVKLLLRLVPIWLSCLMFTVAIAQLHTFYTKQANTLNRKIGSVTVSPASFQVITGLAILTFVPIYQRIVIPTAKRLTGNPLGITMLQRIGCGIFFSILTMILSALVESKRVRTATQHGLMDSPETTLPMSIWWLVPQYVMMGISDVFTIIGLQELFYDQVPEEMRSMGAAAYLSIVGVGNFMSSALISLVQLITAKYGDEWLKGSNLNKAHLDYFYWLLACLSALGLLVYLVLAKGFIYKKLQSDGEVRDDD